MEVRTRFAPSPTGFLHVGGLRTALYNYLFARKNGGKFILRIEDTDRTRFVENATENLIKILEWVSIDYDEGPVKNGPYKPYIQSERFDIYKKYADELLEIGAAYRCFCSVERLEQMRKDQEARHGPPMYDRKCLNLSASEIEKNLASGAPFVIREKIPQDKTIKVEDLIRGNVYFDCKTVDDQILVKSDGFPTYHLANVVDDHLMEISHVIRGEEWLPSTPKHIVLYEALSWKPPQFAHIPLLLNPDRTKLSKRQSDISVDEYKQKGYLPQAVLNFIAFLGWHPGKGITKEIYSLKELIEEFSLEHTHQAGAIFNLEKLNWYNWQWHRKMYFEKPEEARAAELLKIVSPHIPAEWQKNSDLLSRALKTVEEKILQNPPKAEIYLKFYFVEPASDEKLICNEKMKVTLEIAKTSLAESISALEKLSDYSQPEIKKTLEAVIAKLGYTNGQVLWPLRAALTGEQFSPGVFEVIWALGKNHTLARLKSTLNKL